MEATLLPAQLLPMSNLEHRLGENNECTVDARSRRCDAGGTARATARCRKGAAVDASLILPAGARRRG